MQSARFFALLRMTFQVRFLAESTLSEANVLGMTLRLGSGQAFQVRLLRCARNDNWRLCSWGLDKASLAGYPQPLTERSARWSQTRRDRAC